MKKKFTILLAVLMIISTLPITVVPASAASGSNIMVSVPWDKINNCGHQQYSGPCQAYCWAYCRIILTTRRIHIGIIGPDHKQLPHQPQGM